MEVLQWTICAINTISLIAIALGVWINMGYSGVISEKLDTLDEQLEEVKDAIKYKK